MKYNLLAVMLLLTGVIFAQEPIRGTVIQDYNKNKYLTQNAPLEQSGNWLITMGVSGAAAVGFFYFGSRVEDESNRKLLHGLGYISAGLTFVSPIVAGNRLKKHYRERY